MERERLTAKDFSPELLTIFDQYVHGDIDRRGFLDRAAKYAAAPVTAAMLLDMMNPKFAEAQQVPKDDKRIKTESVEIDSPKGYGKIKAYVAKPANATGKLPTVLVIHENRGSESAHRGHRAPPRARQLPRGRARRADARSAATRGRRRQGARAVSEARSDRRRARTSSPPPITRAPAPIPRARLARSASATAAAW